MKKQEEKKEKSFVDLCPECGMKIDLSEADVEYPDVTLECECGANLADTFYETILDRILIKAENAGEDR